MPKSKRNKVGKAVVLVHNLHSILQPPAEAHTCPSLQCCAVNLTKAKKKDKQWKEGLITLVRNAVEE
jgi:hypothetical protein